MTNRRIILWLAGLAGALLLAIGATQSDAWGVVGPAAAVGAVVGGTVVLLRRTNLALNPLHGRQEPSASPRGDLAGIGQLAALTPGQFEEFTRLLFEASGLYQEIRRVGGSGDGGIDLTMRDGAGNLVVVQCKRYNGTVSPAVVRDLYGVMERNRAREAYLITTGRVSHAAQEWIGEKPLHVWGDERLLRYAEEYLGGRLADTMKRARFDRGAPGS